MLLVDSEMQSELTVRVILLPALDTAYRILVPWPGQVGLCDDRASGWA